MTTNTLRHMTILLFTFIVSTSALVATESNTNGALETLQNWLKETAGKNYSIEQLKSLRHLDLDKKGLRDIPPEISNLKNLKALYLEDNQFKEFPPEISNLKNLKALYLDGNQLKELPSEISKLENLKTLTLTYNQLTTLPSTIGNLVKLEQLYLRTNTLTALPPEIGKLENLRYLTIDAGVLEATLMALNETGDQESKTAFLKVLSNLFYLKIGDTGYNGNEAVKSYLKQFTDSLGRMTKGAGTQ